MSFRRLAILRDTVRFSARCKTNHTYSDRYFGVALAVSMNDPRTIGISRFVPRLTPSSRKTLIWEQRDQTVTVQRPTPFQRLNASTPQPNPRALRLLLLCCAHPHSELEDPSCFPPLVKVFCWGVLGASASLPRRLPCLVIQHELLLQSHT